MTAEPPKRIKGSVMGLGSYALLRCLVLGVLFWCEFSALDVARV